MTYCQDQLKFGFKLFILISALKKFYLSIYEQIKATDRIRNKTKSLQSA